MADVFEFSEARGNDRLVLLAIADEADDSGSNAWPSLLTIADKVRLPKRTVIRCIERLESSGELIVTRPERAVKGQSNHYVVVVRKGDTLTPKSKTIKSALERAAPNGTGLTRIPIDQKQDLNPSATSSLFAVLQFDDFWNAYPRKIAKPTARKAWLRAIKRADPAAIIEGAKRYAADPNRTPQYTKHPGPWLNDDRWADEPLPSRTAARKPANDNASTDRARPSGSF